MGSVEVTLYLTAVTNNHLRRFNEWISGQKGTHIGIGYGPFVYHMTKGGFKRTRLVNFEKCNKIEDQARLQVSLNTLESTIEKFQSKRFSSKRFWYSCVATLFKRFGIKLPVLKVSRDSVLCNDFASVLLNGRYCSHYLIPSETFEFVKLDMPIILRKNGEGCHPVTAPNFSIRGQN